MGGTFFGLEIAKRGLFAQRAALDVTGHNIANRSTPGYSRQRANMEATSPLPYPGLVNSPSYGQVGTGVEVTTIDRLRNQFLDGRFWGQNPDLGEWEAKEKVLGQIEMFMQEPSDTSLRQALSDFWDAWHTLSGNPSNGEMRGILAESGKTVADMINATRDSLTQLHDDVKREIEQKTDRINEITKQIGDINKQIKEISAHDYTPNDLMDRRDLLLDELSKLVDVSVSPIFKDNKDTGMVSVKVGSEYVVADGTGQSNTMSVELNSSTAKYEVKLYPGVMTLPPPSSSTGTSITLKSGEMKGLIDSYNETIPRYINKLDDFSGKLHDDINALHKSGYNAYGNKEAIDFFTQDAATGKISVNSEIIDDHKRIAASTGVGTDSYNNGQNAQEIAKKINEIIPGYLTIIGELGIESGAAKNNKSNSQHMVDSLENMRMSVSSVSLDEEMTNMIKFNQAYNAATRVITTVDEMLDKIINGMGLVGR